MGAAAIASNGPHCCSRAAIPDEVNLARVSPIWRQALLIPLLWLGLMRLEPLPRPFLFAG